MPLYDYVCMDEDCPTVGFSASVSVDERNEVPCPTPECHEPPRRILSLPHVAPIGGIPNRLNRHWSEGGTAIDVAKVDAFIDGATRP